MAMYTELTTPAPAALAADVGAAFGLYDAAALRFLATRKSAKTRQTYGVAMELYRAIAWQARVDPLRADALILFNTEMQTRRRDRGGNLANDTIRVRMAAVGKFFSWCWAFDLTQVKPELVREELLKDKPPARQLSPRDVLTAAEARRLIAAAGDIGTRLLLRTLLDAGLRISEALGLRPDDIYPNEEKCWLHVQNAKGGEPRQVEIPTQLFRDLVEYAGGGGRIFPMDRTTAWRHVKAAAVAAGIKKRLSPHGLRHTHANSLRRAGYPLDLIAQRLGHKSVQTTQRYTRPAELAMQQTLPEMPWNDAI